MRIIPPNRDALNNRQRAAHGLWVPLIYPDPPTQLITGGSRSQGQPMMPLGTPGPRFGSAGGRTPIGFGSLLGPLYLAPYRSLY